MLFHGVKWTERIWIHLVWRSTPLPFSRNGHDNPPKGSSTNHNEKHQSLKLLSMADHAISCAKWHSPQVIHSHSPASWCVVWVCWRRNLSSLHTYILEGPPMSISHLNNMWRWSQLHDCTSCCKNMWRNQHATCGMQHPIRTADSVSPLKHAWQCWLVGVYGYNITQYDTRHTDLRTGGATLLRCS